MQRRLSPARNPNPLAAAVRPIRYLREYSNYLTPKTGFLSADTWTMLGIFSRNALLNQVILVSLFAGFLLLPRLALKLTWMGYLARPGTTYLAAGAVIVLCGIATYLLVANLRRLDPQGKHPPEERRSTMQPASEPKVPKYARPFFVQVGVVLPWLIAASIVAQVFPWHFSARFEGNVGGPGTAGIVAGLYLGLILLAGKASRCWENDRSGWLGALALAVAASGATVAAVLWVLGPVVHRLGLDESTALPWHAAVLGGPGLLLIFSLAIVVMLGMLGEKFPDEHREWWSRLRSFMHMYAAAWLACFVVALYVPWGWRYVQHCARQLESNGRMGRARRVGRIDHRGPEDGRASRVGAGARKPAGIDGQPAGTGRAHHRAVRLHCGAGRGRLADAGRDLPSRRRFGFLLRILEVRDGEHRRPRAACRDRIVLCRRPAVFAAGRHQRVFAAPLLQEPPGPLLSRRVARR